VNHPLGLALEMLPGDDEWARLRAAAGVPRYTATPLPPYAFLPGRDPHPSADPRGHSHGVVRRAPVWVPPEQWRQSEAYLFGCDLFNAGFWWEAHEAWEGLWLQCPSNGEQALFLQALIQAANALLKRRMDRPRAVQRLGAQVTGLVAEVSRPRRHYMGLALSAWHRRFVGYLGTAPTLCWPHEGFPFLRLE